jgi:hypothetical protein
MAKHFDYTSYKNARSSALKEQYGYGKTSVPKRASGSRTRTTEQNLAPTASRSPHAVAADRVKPRRRSGGGCVDDSDILAMRQDDAELEAKLNEKFQSKANFPEDASAPLSQAAAGLQDVGEMRSGVMRSKFQMGRPGGITAGRQPQPSPQQLFEQAEQQFQSPDDDNGQ